MAISIRNTRFFGKGTRVAPLMGRARAGGPCTVPNQRPSAATVEMPASVLLLEETDDEDSWRIGHGGQAKRALWTGVSDWIQSQR